MKNQIKKYILYIVIVLAVASVLSYYYTIYIMDQALKSSGVQAEVVLYENGNPVSTNLPYPFTFVKWETTTKITGFGCTYRVRVTTTQPGLTLEKIVVKMWVARVYLTHTSSTSSTPLSDSGIVWDGSGKPAFYTKTITGATFGTTYSYATGEVVKLSDIITSPKLSTETDYYKYTITWLVTAEAYVKDQFGNSWTVKASTPDKYLDIGYVVIGDEVNIEVSAT